MQEFSGGGAEKKVGANNAYDIRVVGLFLREICPNLGHFLTAECVPPGALAP